MGVIMTHVHRFFTNVTKVRVVMIVCIICVSLFSFSTTSAIPGDIDKNNTIDIADIVALVVYLFDPNSNTVDKIDTTAINIDGCFGKDISDFNYLVNYIFEQDVKPDTAARDCLTESGGSLSIDSVIGLTYEGLLPLDKGTVTFNIRLTTDTICTGLTNGFRVYSPDGATWTKTVPDTVFEGLQDYFDLIFNIGKLSSDGVGADTIGFGGAGMLGNGLPSGFNEEVYSLTIGPIPKESAGKTICIDSTFYPPLGIWKWAGQLDKSTMELNNRIPSWDGPHCYQVESGKK